MTTSARERIRETLWRAFRVAIERGDIVSAYGFAARIRALGWS